MPGDVTLPQIQFTADEWNRTPEPVRRFVRELKEAAERLADASRSDTSGRLGTQPRQPGSVHSGPHNQKQVVFVSDRPLTREAKLAWGLRRAGRQVVLLCGAPPAFDADAVCAEVRPYRNPKEAVALARQYAPIAYHVFSCWSYDVAAALLRNGLAPVVHDNYDVMAGLVHEELLLRNHPGQIELERYCLEHAHGHCCRSLESQPARHRLRYRMEAPRILVTDMCWGTGVPDVPKLSARDGALHIVYCGNLFKGPPEARSDNNFHYLTAAVLSRRSVHYHIYPSTQELAALYRTHMPAYSAAHGDPAFVHIHDPAPCDRLIDELAQYDAGVQILSRNVEMSDSDPTYYADKAVYAAANKVFDYADAGIPVLIHGGMFQRSLVRRYRLGRSIRTIEEIADALPGARIEPPRVLTVDANVSRLIRFYDLVAEACFRVAA